MLLLLLLLVLVVMLLLFCTHHLCLAAVFAGNGRTSTPAEFGRRQAIVQCPQLLSTAVEARRGGLAACINSGLHTFSFATLHTSREL